MDIHQIMQYTGQVMYILLKTFCAWIERLSGAIGALLIVLDAQFAQGADTADTERDEDFFKYNG